MPAVTLPATPRPPYDRFVARRGDSAGGMDARGYGRTITPGLIDGTIREGEDGGYGRDDTIFRERIPWYDRDYQYGNGDTRTDWTNSGPIRPSLHMRNETSFRQQGSDATRNFDPRPMPRVGGIQDQGHGMHTNPEPSKKSTNATYRARPQMEPTRQGRLTSARYTGQSYSQTTRMQGG